MMSDSFMMRSSSPSSLISVPDHLPNRMRSPTFRSSGMSLPVSSRPPGPTATTSPSCGFSLAVSGMMMPPLVFSSASMRLTTTRSCNGRNFMGFLLVERFAEPATPWGARVSSRVSRSLLPDRTEPSYVFPASLREFKTAGHEAVLPVDLFPVASIIALPVDGDDRFRSDRAAADAAPVVDRVVAGGGHRNDIRVGVGAAEFARPRQRAARVHFAAVQVGADPASQKFGSGAAHESRVTREVDRNVERFCDLSLEFAWNGNRRARRGAGGAKIGAARSR